MEEHIRDFLDYLLVERGMSENTVAAYASDLRFFAEFLSEEDAARMALLTRQSVLAFFLHQKSQGMATATISRRMSALRAFCSFLLMDVVLEKDSTMNMDFPKLEKTYPTVLSYDEV